MVSSTYPLAITAKTPTITANTDILSTPLVILADHVSPGGGAALRCIFSFAFGTTPATVSVFKNGALKGNFNADNSSNVITDGYYRFDIDVEEGDSLNFRASQTITTINELRTHLIPFGA